MGHYFAFLKKTELVEKNKRVFTALFLAYIALGFVIVLFDLGNTQWGQWIANLGQSKIPAIKGTAELTSAYHSAALLLTISWVWGSIMYAPIAWLLITAAPQVVNWEHWNKVSPIIKIGAWSFTATGIFLLANMVPSNAAGIEWLIHMLLETSPFYVLLLGITIWATVWMGLLLPTIGFISLVEKSNRGENHE